MMKTDLHILMLEDDPLDAELNTQQLLLLEEYNCKVKLVSERKSYIDALDEYTPDIILCDYNLPDYTGLEAMNYLMSKNPFIPFIFVTGAMNEETAADAIKAGAWDYVVKDRLFRLPLAVKSVLKLREEKKIAAVAEEKANRLLMAIEQISAQVIITDHEGKVEYVNRHFTEVTGNREEDIIGTNAQAIISDVEHPEEIIRNLDGLLEGKSITFELKRRQGNDNVLWDSVAVSPIRDAEKNITNYVAIIEDITLRKQMEQDIIGALNKAERSDRMKEAFLQNLSHEIRTPLNAIVGFSGLLNSNEDFSEEERKHYTSIITNNSNQLLTIVSDVLTMASIETGEVEFNKTIVDICALYDQLYRDYSERIKGKNIELIYKKPEGRGPCLIETDEVKLSEILKNLLNNALKFTLEGSVQLDYEITGDTVKFYIRDTGIGIDKEDQQKIFERFRQANDDIHVNYGGAGLGLTIAKSFAGILEGSIQVESESGRGSVFCLSIPYLPASATTVQETAASAKLIKPLKILIAEDEMDNYLLLESVLGREGSSVLHALNGQSAVDLVQKNNLIHIVLMDIRMPVMDGVQSFKEIRKINSTIPVIALTAYAQEVDKIRLLQMGFSDFILKPVNIDELIRKINKAVRTSE